jgi:tight adherence protein C
MDSLSGAIGRWAASRFSRFKLPDYRSRLVSAGMYNASPERLLGMQFLTAVGLVFAWIALAALGDMAAWIFLFGLVAAAILGWLAPAFIVDRKARKRREQIEKDLPDLIDLVVVTLEAGLSFPQSLRLAATKIKEPLAGEVRLTLQEQNMGLTLVEALENFLSRIDTPGVRMFARSIAQGEIMGVSTGQIMRNLAIELRKRRKAYAEERAQKAPVKMLFPIAFLIMPALFIVLLVPMVIIIMDVL